MRIGIVGAGRVGTALGGALAERGHTVVYGVRDPEGRASDHGTFAAVREAAAQGEVVILATPWAAAEDAVKACGDLGGRPLLDATNPFGAGFAVEPGASGAQRVQDWAPTARVVKAFNTTGAENLARPPAGAAMFVCGDDPHALEVAASLARDLGFVAVPVRGLANAGLVESLARLWIQLAVVQKEGRGTAFGWVRG